MTLHKKSSRKPPAYHRKVTGAHHRRSKRYHETYWPYIPLVLLILIGIIGSHPLKSHHSVLDYATDMSVQSLLDDTNAQRASNGEPALSLNSQLNNAAQAKANDMATRDYWSHTTPDGQQPWSFMTAAGYNYRLAGENLAYGFATAADTLTGWMNSPGHRANILNTGYSDVGFGFINIANYQNSGPETLVVAMYGAPQIASVDATPPAPVTTSDNAPVHTSTGSASPSPAPAGAPADTPATAASLSPSSDTLNKQATTTINPNAAKQATIESKPQHIAQVQLLTAGKASWSVLITTLIGLSGLALFLLRHGIAWHKIFIRGERYLLSHPLLDIVLVGLISAALLLTRTVGQIR